MFYNFSLIIPAGTLKTAPEVTRMPLTHGVIHTVRIDFPPGPRGEVHLAINRGLHQLFPSNDDGDFCADNTYINFDDYEELFADPYVLEVRGWAPTAVYDHTLNIQIGIVESKVALVSLRIAKGIETVLKLMGVSV